LNIKRSGLTLVELMAVLTIIGVLVALLLPAIEHVRESARRAYCQNNLRQSAIAIQLFHDSRKKLPSLYNGSFAFNGSTKAFPEKYWDEYHFHSWQTALLPHLEQSSLFDRLDMEVAASSPSNQSNVRTELSVFLCPSTSNYTRFRPVSQYSSNEVIGISARGEYEALGGILLHKNPTVNETNDGGLYSFHNSGANVAFADGSIRVLASSTDAVALHAMATRAGNEVVGMNGF